MNPRVLYGWASMVMLANVVILVPTNKGSALISLLASCAWAFLAAGKR